MTLNSSDLSISDSVLDYESSIQANNDKEKIEELEKKVLLYQSQYEKALTLAQSIDSTNNELTQAKEMIRKLQSEKEELSHRFEICQQTNEYLTKQMEEEKKSNSQYRQESIVNIRQENKRLREELQIVASKANEQAKQYMSELEARDISIKTNNSKMARLLKQAERSLNMEFVTIDGLVDYISNYGLPKQLEAQEVQPIQPQEIGIPEEKYKKLLKKVRALKLVIQESDQKIIEDQRQIEKLNKVINDRNASIESLNTELKIEKERNEHSAKCFEEQVSDLKTKLLQKQKQVQQPQQVNAQPQVVIQKVIDTKKMEDMKQDYENKLQNMENKLSTRVSEVAALKAQIMDLNNKNDDILAKYEELSQENSELKNKVFAAEMLKEEAIKNVESLRTALHTKEQIISQAQAKKASQSERQNNAMVEKFTAQLDAKSRLIIELQTNQATLNTQIDDQKRQIGSLERQLDEYAEKAKQAVFDLQDAQKVMEKSQITKSDDGLTSQAFTLHTFPLPLSDEISRIASNSSLQPSSKLQAIYSTIQSFFDREIIIRDQRVTETVNRALETSKLFGSFLVDLSVTATDEAITLDDFLNNGGDCIISAVASIRSAHDEIQHEFERQALHIEQISSALNCQPDSLLECAQSIKDKLCDLTNKAQQYKKNVKELSCCLKKQSSELGEEIANLKEENESLIEENLKLKENNSSLEKKLNSANTENEYIRKELAETQKELTKAKDECDEIIAEKENAIKASYEIEIGKIATEKKVVEEALEELQESNEQQKQELERVKSENSSLFEECQNAKAELENSKKANNERIEVLIKHFEDEKMKQRKSLESAMEGLKSQCASYRDDVEEMAAEIAESNARANGFKQMCAKLQVEKRKAESDLEMHTESFEMERRVLEATARGKILEAEREFNNRIEAAKQQAVTERRELIAFAANKLNAFFNPIEQLSERSFRVAIETAQLEFKRLNSADERIRRMLGVCEGQTTEDAVARLLVQ